MTQKNYTQLHFNTLIKQLTTNTNQQLSTISTYQYPQLSILAQTSSYLSKKYKLQLNNNISNYLYSFTNYNSDIDYDASKSFEPLIKKHLNKLLKFHNLNNKTFSTQLLNYITTNYDFTI